MTFDQIVSRVKGRLNLSSADATARIGEYVNDRYHQLTSSIGLEPVRIGKADLVVAFNLSGLPEITTTIFDKITRVTLVVGTSLTTLSELTYDDLTAIPTNTGNPRAWAVKTYNANSVVFVIDAYPSSGTFTLRLEGYTRLTEIAGSTEPVVPEDFHDILIHGAMADELRKMEKPQLAQISEAKYEQRLSDLRMFIAKSAYLDIVQGKNKPSVSWYRPWFSRISMN